MKRILSICLVIALLVLTVAGCGGGGGDATTASSDVKIGVSMGTTGNLFFARMVEIIEERAAELGVEVVVTDENWDLNNQISSIENFISMGVTAILMVVFDDVGVQPIVQEAVDRGIFVMTYDGFVDGAQGSLNLDNWVYGYQVGQMAADWVNAHPVLSQQEVVEAGIFDFPDIPLIIDRADGIAHALTTHAPNVQIVARQKAGVGDEGVVMGENFLTAHPNMQIIAGINDTGVLGAFEAWSAAGNVGENIGLFGADGDDRALELIAQGTAYRGTVMSGAFAALPIAVDILVAASRGEEVDGHMVYDTVPVTPANVHEFLD